MADLTAKFKLLENDSKAPTRAYSSDSGWDLYSYEDIIINPKQTANVYTGVAVCVSEGWGYTLRGRSSLNRSGVHLAMGTMDANYVGPIRALLFNVSDTPYTIKRGDRIAQIVFEKIWDVDMIEVKDFELPEGVRGSNGFGSSGR